MTQFYGLKPEDIDRMTMREVSEYVTQFAKHRAEEARHGG